VLVNTCAGYEPVATPPLLASLAAAGVPPECTFVVVGESAADEQLPPGPHGETRIARRYINIDNNGLLWACERDNRALDAFDWVFYTHDTSYVHAEFWSRARALVRDRLAGSNDLCCKLHRTFSMGMGFYRASWLRDSDDLRAYLATLINYDPGRKTAIKNNLNVLEDTLFKYAQRTCNRCGHLANNQVVQARGVRMYNSDVPRILEYWESPGVYKVKANWGQSRTLFTAL
jgi:hypothetical protein